MRPSWRVGGRSARHLLQQGAPRRAAVPRRRPQQLLDRRSHARAAAGDARDALGRQRAAGGEAGIDVGEQAAGLVHAGQQRRRWWRLMWSAESHQ